MTSSEALTERFAGQPAVLPEPATTFALHFVDDDGLKAEEPDAADDPDPISAFVCVIDYSGDLRFITCRRYDVIGDNGYVGAICHSANGYRQFRCDRIISVADAVTGEVLGDGRFFERFTPKTTRTTVPTWGLTSSRKSLLVAGLNVLAFMAHCDGHWHQLEVEPVEKFICSLWLRKEWDDDPPIDEIVAHARRLAPDADTFFRALNRYAPSRTSSAVLTRAIADLVAADGVICAAETAWSIEVASYLDSRRSEVFTTYFLNGEGGDDPE